MYWDSSWVDSSSKNIFFKKVLLSIDLINIFFLENFFLNFFKKKNFLKKKNFFKKFFFKNKSILQKKSKKIKKKVYNFSRTWFIKYNTYILLSICVYTQSKKNKVFLKKINLRRIKLQTLFWKKRKGTNIKRKVFLLGGYNHLHF